jgi:hypothetical protein
MKSRYEGFSPLIIAPVIATSGEMEAGTIDCRNLDKILITAKVTFNASGTIDATVKLLYSPDGKNYDTIVFGSLTVTKTTGESVQVSKLFDVPDTGWIKIVISNGDESYTITNIFCWASVIYKFIADRQTQATT